MILSRIAIAAVAAVATFAALPECRAQPLPAFDSQVEASGSYSYAFGWESSGGIASESRYSRGVASVAVGEGIDYASFHAASRGAPGSLDIRIATKALALGPGLPYGVANADAQASAYVWTNDYLMILGGDGVASASAETVMIGSPGEDGVWMSGQPSIRLGIGYAPVDRSDCLRDPDLCTPAYFNQLIASDSLEPVAEGQPISFSRRYENVFLFQYGVPFQVNASLSASAWAVQSMKTDLDISVSFLLRLPEGARVVSQSGFSYAAAAVPEPGTYPLIAAGLAGLGIVTRRARRRR